MQDYRLYFLGADGHIQAASDLFAGSLSEAKAAAAPMYDGRTLELWRRAERLHVWAADPDRAEALHALKSQAAGAPAPEGG